MKIPLTCTIMKFSLIDLHQDLEIIQCWFCTELAKTGRHIQLSVGDLHNWNFSAFLETEKCSSKLHALSIITGD